jgi:hypothetical protein
MDRASILGDAIEYLKELLRKIEELQNEVESSASPASTASLPPTPTSFRPLTPTLPALPSRVKEELCPSALPSPTSKQPRVSIYTYFSLKPRFIGSVLSDEMVRQKKNMSY